MPRTLKELRAAETWIYRDITDLPEDLWHYLEPDDAGGINRFFHPLVVGLWPLVTLMPIEGYRPGLAGVGRKARLPGRGGRPLTRGKVKAPGRRRPPTESVPLPIA